MPGVSGSQQSHVPLAQGQWGRRSKRILKHAPTNVLGKGSCEVEVFRRGTGFGLSSAERHLAREKLTISHEKPQGITGKMPVPR
jgi:hypothetical protein